MKIMKRERCLVLFSAVMNFVHLPFIDSSPDNKGREFIIGFMENTDNSRTDNLELFITTQVTKVVNVNITAPRFTASNINHKISVTSGQVVQLSLPNSLRMSGTSKDPKAIFVEADDEVVLYGINRDTYSNDGYLGLPVDVLGSEYYTVSWHPAKERGEFIIIGVHDATTVTVHLSTSLGNSMVDWGGRSYGQNEDIVESLDKFDIFQVQSQGDLTGTHITADKAIGVISGNIRTNIDSSSSDHLTEMIVPLDNYGKTFITIPIPERTAGDYFKIVASEDATTVAVRGGHSTDFTLASAGDMKQLDLPSSAYCFINSTKPILVVQFVKSQTNNEEADPAMMTIPPIELYGADYTFSTPKYSQGGSYINYFMFAIRAVDKDGLKLDGSPLATTFQAIEGTDYVGGYVTVPEGTHVVHHDSPIKTFGGFLYGRASYESYAFPVGLRLARINGDCVVSVTVGGDGVDNDCDGRIDEEICDSTNVDDDSDGKIDEDCAQTFSVNGNWADWSAWTPCSLTCRTDEGDASTGSQSRNRTCTNPAPSYGGSDCSGISEEAQTCSASTLCPVNGNWTDWTVWGPCSLTCKDGEEKASTGSQTRQRTCTNPAPDHGGVDCVGDSDETQMCTSNTPCPVDGQWTIWTAWTTCSQSCKDNLTTSVETKTRQRACTNPSPAHGGLPCQGETSETASCPDIPICPVHGNWSEWSSWGQCSLCLATPTAGARFTTPVTETKARTCSDPAPAYGGIGCLGESTQSRHCGNVVTCQESCFCPCEYVGDGITHRARNLKIPKKSTFRHRSSKISAADDRLSATLVGSVVVVCLFAAPVTTLVLSDIPRLIREVRTGA